MRPMRQLFALVGLFFFVWLPINGVEAAGTVTVITVDTGVGGADVGRDTSLALVDGLPAISYYDTTNDDLKYARCNDATCSSATITIIDETGNVGEESSLAVVGGLPSISYHDESNNNLKYARCSDVNCTGPVTINTVDSASNVGEFTSLVNLGGLPAISYREFSNTALKYVRCDDVNCASATPVTVDDAGNVGRYTSLAVVSGLPAISYRDDSNSALKYALCDDAACNTATINTVDSVGFVGEDTSLALVDGQPSISYVGGSSLRYARCGNDACDTANTEIVEASSNVGVGTSLVEGSDGLPIITHQPTSSLRFVQCDGVDCATSTIRTLDDMGDVGKFSSTALVGSGLVGVSYYDMTNGDLKYALVDPILPSVENAAAPDVTTDGQTTYTVDVTYDALYDTSTLDATDITISGPAGTLTVTGATVTANADNGDTITVTYDVTPPDGSFVLADNGTYTVALVDGQVSDQYTNALAGQSLVTFDVNIETTVVDNPGDGGGDEPAVDPEPTAAPVLATQPLTRGASSAALAQVSQLPSTGETPPWRMPTLVVLGLGMLLMLGTVLRRKPSI